MSSPSSTSPQSSCNLPDAGFRTEWQASSFAHEQWCVHACNFSFGSLPSLVRAQCIAGPVEMIRLHVQEALSWYRTFKQKGGSMESLSIDDSTDESLESDQTTIEHSPEAHHPSELPVVAFMPDLCWLSCTLTSSARILSACGAWSRWARMLRLCE